MTSNAKRGPAGEFVGHDEIVSESIETTIARIIARRKLCEGATGSALTPSKGMSERVAWMALVSTPALD